MDVQKCFIYTYIYVCIGHKDNKDNRQLTATHLGSGEEKEEVNKRKKKMSCCQ